MAALLLLLDDELLCRGSSAPNNSAEPDFNVTVQLVTLAGISRRSSDSGLRVYRVTLSPGGGSRAVDDDVGPAMTMNGESGTIYISTDDAAMMRGEGQTTEPTADRIVASQS
jgi:hypothetical protein